MGKKEAQKKIIETLKELESLKNFFKSPEYDNKKEFSALPHIEECLDHLFWARDNLNEQM